MSRFYAVSNKYNFVFTKTSEYSSFEYFHCYYANRIVSPRHKTAYFKTVKGLKAALEREKHKLGWLPFLINNQPQFFDSTLRNIVPDNTIHCDFIAGMVDDMFDSIVIIEEK